MQLIVINILKIRSLKLTLEAKLCNILDLFSGQFFFIKFIWHFLIYFFMFIFLNPLVYNFSYFQNNSIQVLCLKHKENWVKEN